MQHKRLVSVLCGVFTIFFAVATTGPSLASDGTPLKDAEIKALVSGKEVKAKIKGRQGIVSYTARLDDDGRIATRVDFGGPSDRGRWTVSDSIYCAKYNRFRFGKEHCWQILKTGDGEYLMKGLDGAKDQTIKVADAETLLVRSK